MKRLLLIAISALAIFAAAHAADFTLRKAIDDFAKSKDIKVTKSLTKGFDPASAGYGPKYWSVLKYDFTGTPKSIKSKIEKIIEAYDRDFSAVDIAEVFNAYLLHDGASLDADLSIRYSERVNPIEIDDSNNLMLFSAIERPGLNTIFVAQWEDTDESLSECGGTLYIIERDPAFTARPAVLVPEYNEDLTRLSFYASKYLELGDHDSSSAITEATIFVVEDIIRHGTPQDREAAEIILDRMIAMPLNISAIGYLVREERQLSQQTLVNLLHRLGSAPVVHSRNPNSFSIEGTIDKELWDIGYNVRTSADGLEIIPENVATIKAIGKNFYYEDSLPEICIGQLNALLKDGSEINAAIRIPFVPGECAEINVHNGYFSLGGSTFYNDYSQGRNAPRNNAKKQIEYAKENIRRPGIICYMFIKDIVTDPEVRRKIYDMLPDDMKEGIYGHFLRKYL
ncbi:MAG: hypothetical protein K2K37_03920 [Muribaculaceae bacterium]|nr:hypothetical protein [Muribaculaceae bacterium]